MGDPRSSKMQKNLNLKVKYRESFRPFAPSILKEDIAEWFDIDVDSPYMLLVANIKLEKTIKMNDEQKKLSYHQSLAFFGRPSSDPLSFLRFVGPILRHSYDDLSCIQRRRALHCVTVLCSVVFINISTNLNKFSISFSAFHDFMNPQIKLTMPKFWAKDSTF